MLILDGMFHLLAEVLQEVEFVHAGHHLSGKRNQRTNFLNIFFLVYYIFHLLMYLNHV